MIMGPDKRTIGAAAVLVWLGVLACAAPGAAQTTDEKGAWQIAAPRDADTAPDKFSLSAPALGQPGAKLSLSCRKDPGLYYFAVESSGPTPPPPDAAARFSIRVTNQEPIWFQTTWRADGGINVEERAHQTAFSIMLMLLIQSGSTTVEFLVDDQRLTFSLDGFADLTDVLRQRCGYDYRRGPDQRRGR
jgi:hypothetical protein